MTSRIIVIGSVNMDLVIRCAQLPRPGETVIADTSTEVPGGKGANQAVAAARAGGTVAMLGRVGDDAFADRLLENLQREQVNIDLVARSTQCASGVAVVAVEQSGENSILVVPGANGRVTPQDIQSHEASIRESDLVLLQLEIPMESVVTAVEIASRGGVPVILDPAPMPSARLPDAVLGVDLICPNQAEASAMLGRSIETVDDASVAAKELQQAGPRNVVITMAGDGAVVCTGDSVEWIRPQAIKPVDTTAAGDAFAGAFAVRMTQGASTIDAAEFASAAGAIAATRNGAQPAMPTAAEIHHMLGTSQ